MRYVSAVSMLVFATSAMAAIPSSERDALVAVYNAAGGANWTDKTNWLGAPGTECDWYGVGCDETQSNVTNLDLGDNNLRGTLSPEIAKLPKLRDLQIYANELGGQLPGELGQLADIEDIYIDANQFTGQLPPQLGALKKLELLGMSANHFSGPIPPAFGDMSALRELNLAANALNGQIPADLTRLTNLEVLNLTQNQLSGPIPVELGTLSKLRELSLSDNQLSGNIPAQLGNLAALQLLYASYNKLDGSIPPQLGQLRALEALYLSSNQLSGKIPDALGDLGALKLLYLGTNKLTGDIPAGLFRATALEELHLDDNQLTGQIPVGVARLVNLQVLNLYANGLTGSIPVEVTTIAPLRTFSAGYNMLTGAIPPEIGRLTNLTELDLAHNRLDGRLPRELGNLSKLTFLYLYDNQIGGTIPPELGQLANLGVFHVGANSLTGTIPDTLRNLTKLEQFNVGGNTLSGSLPVWIGELTRLQEFVAGANQFIGTIPTGVAALDRLYVLDVSQNFLTGPLPDFTRLGTLGYANFEGNQLSGSIPAGIGVLTNVIDARFSNNAFTGPLPHEIGNLTNAEYVVFANNLLEGTIPAEIGNLKKVYSLELYGNRFTGTIPPQIGDMSGLQFLGLSFNALRGPVPPEITKLTKLEDGRSDFSYNALFTNDAAVRAFLNRKHYSPNFAETQTVTPANVRVTQTTDRSATLTWTPIEYVYDDGGYQVIASKTAGGPPSVIATTATKQDDTMIVRNLDPSTSYVFTVSTVTHPHDIQQNLLVSDLSPGVPASTGPRVIAPAEVVVTEAPQGSVQIDGVEVVADSFTLTNYGDVGTNVELELGDDFFTVEPATFALGAGASKVVNIRTLPKQPGTYYGYATVRGTGVADGTYVTVILLSVQQPAGSVVATPISTRIELAGAPGSDSIGIAQFRNSGTADLRGILVSDQPWIQPDQQPITISPGTIGSVNFRVVRARRPLGVEGALTATLTLVYVAGETQTLDVAPVNVSKVTVVDTTKPPVTPGTAPFLLQGEVAFFAPGVSAARKLGGTLGSDLSILNSSSGRAVGDLRLYFTAAGGTETKVATLPSVAAATSVSLVSLVTNIYSAPDSVGTLQIRSADWRNVAVAAKLTNLKAEGTFTGDVPVFRSDRSAGSGQPIYLTGVRKPSDIFVQETSGAAANVRVEFLDAAGAPVGTTITQPVGALGLLELRDTVPAGAVTAVLTPGSTGRLAAYARVADETSGDTWSVADWGRVNKFALTESVRIAVADGIGGAGGGTKRRRPVLHAAGPPRAATDVTIFNPGSTEARAKLQVLDAAGNVAGEREVILDPKKTTTITDAAAAASSATAHIVIDPTRGSVVVTARSQRLGKGTYGSAIPVVAAGSGLRVGQTQTFADLHDSTAATVAAATPATFRTSYGFVETAGQTATVRARVVIIESRSLVAAKATITRDFHLAPRQQIVLEDLVRSIAGAARETEFGDLHGLQLQIEVTAGGGAVVPFVIVTDNGSRDSLVRLE
ncbi:MAG: fibronectin type III domain-containing protein [Acidobacteriota bacterium]